MVTISIRVFVYLIFSQRARFRGGVHGAGLCVYVSTPMWLNLVFKKGFVSLSHFFPLTLLPLCSCLSICL